MIDFNITTKKNLLAFSGGIDSTALFFLFLEQNIPFDIAIVDYNVREQSKNEVAYAKELAKKYDKTCYIKEVTLKNSSNFEKQARDIRYNFFEELITNHNYETLITAHQLNDRLEWFLMQLTKGAGLSEILGFNKFEQKDNYTLYRPLLTTSKETLLSFLKEQNINYFVDESNSDIKYKRNKVRLKFANDLIKEHEIGIKNSFEYLNNDLASLNIHMMPTIQEKELEVFKNINDDNLSIRVIDKSLKKRGLLLSKAQRKEILDKKELVISHKFAIAWTSQAIWIAPYDMTTMEKKFKEKCRVLKIPKNIRGYLSKEEIKIENLAIF